jgi:uncharacterized DUF497 family protein
VGLRQSQSGPGGAWCRLRGGGGDDRAITREDPDSVGKQRFVTLGLSGLGNLLVVVYAWRGPVAIRLISAWKANARQRKQYAQATS